MMPLYGMPAPVLVTGYPMCFILAPCTQYTTNRNETVETYGPAQPPAIREALSESLPPSACEARPVLAGRKCSVLGQVWSLSCDASGCRDVQDAIDAAQSDDECVAIADELRGHVWEALCCPHANYVLQKFITKTRSQSSQFIIDELLQIGCLGEAARHKYGCRVLQRILEHCRADQVKPIVDELLADAIMLSKHPYASYVLQHIFEQGTDEQQNSLMELLIANAVTLAADCWACAVMEKALMYGDLESCLELASRILQEKGLVAQMAPRRRGHLVVKLILDLFEEGSTEWASVRAQLRDEEASLRKARFGRVVLGLLSQAVSSGCDP